MSTSFITFIPSTLSVTTSAARRNPSSSTSWFNPIFGWPNTPDYIDSVSPDSDTVAADPEQKPKRFVAGGFTAEKAKQLRMMTTGKDAFHDVMYHSAIASRLASDFSTKLDS